MPRRHAITSYILLQTASFSGVLWLMRPYWNTALAATSALHSTNNRETSTCPFSLDKCRGHWPLRQHEIGKKLEIPGNQCARVAVWNVLCNREFRTRRLWHSHLHGTQREIDKYQHCLFQTTNAEQTVHYCKNSEFKNVSEEVSHRVRFEIVRIEWREGRTPCLLHWHLPCTPRDIDTFQHGFWHTTNGEETCNCKNMRLAGIWKFEKHMIQMCVLKFCGK